MNPPYSKTGEDGKRSAVVGDWLRKARQEARKGAHVVCLLVNDPSTGWWADHVMAANEIRFLLGDRLRFDDAKGSPTFTNVIAVFNGSKTHKAQMWNWRKEIKP
jgi:hypothetical protein